jgi:PAS domain S-box-containing protein
MGLKLPLWPLVAMPPGLRNVPRFPLTEHFSATGAPQQWPQSVLDALESAIVVTDQKGSIIRANAASRKLLPVAGDRLDFHRFYEEDGVTPCRPENFPLELALRGAASSEAQLTVHDGHGASIIMRITANPIPDANGRPAGAVLKATKEVIGTHSLAGDADLKSRFYTLMEVAPDAILEVDSTGKIVLVNQTAEKMFGYTRQEILGMNVDALVPSAMRHSHNQHRTSYASHAQSRPMGIGLELRAQRKDGSLLPVEISLSPNPGPGGMRVIAVVRDITARRRIEDKLRAVQDSYNAELTAKNEQLEARNRDIERANRLKTEFLASMSHELRTPLHTIIGFAELLTEGIEGPLGPKQQRFLNHILQDSRHLLELINEILDISKIESGKLQLQISAIEFPACLEEVLSGIHQQAAQKNIRLEVNNKFQDIIFADRLRLKEVLYNLLTNAVKFTSEGGRVWVDGIAQDGWLQVTVGDTGVGIATEEQENIFEKFYQVGATTKGTREGTGLGLPITRQLVQLHGGRLWLESAPGEGSRFTFTLPLAGPSQK